MCLRSIKQQYNPRSESHKHINPDAPMRKGIDREFCVDAVDVLCSPDEIVESVRARTVRCVKLFVYWLVNQLCAPERANADTFGWLGLFVQNLL